MSDYIKTNWVDGDIITAEKLNNMEDGIVKGCPKFVQIRERQPDFSQELTEEEIEEEMERFRQKYICDPNAIDPTKQVYGLYKIFPKNLKCSDFIGTIFEQIIDNSTGISNISTTTIIGAISFNSSDLELTPYIELITADEYSLYYFPTTGYFGEASLLGRMVLDLGYINLDNSGTQVSLDIEPQMSISELHNLSDNDWIPYAINASANMDNWGEGEIEFLDDHSARIDFDLGGGRTISISLFDDSQATISGINNAIGADGMKLDLAIIMLLS